jgi:hypothetical protein
MGLEPRSLCSALEVQRAKKVDASSGSLPQAYQQIYLVLFFIPLSYSSIAILPKNITWMLG